MKHKRKQKHLEPSLLGPPEKRAREQLDFQDDLQGRNDEVALTQNQEETFTGSSNHLSCEDKSFCAGLSQGAEEKSTNLEHCSKVSPAGQCSAVKQEGVGSSEMLLYQDRMERETFFFNSRSLSPWSFASSSPSSLESSEEKQLMNIYYMHVPKKRGAAVLGDAEEDSEPPQKRIRIARINIPSKLLPKLSLSYMRDILSDSEESSTSEVQEQRAEAESPSRPGNQDTGGSVQVPEEPVDLQGGFKCMGCHQLFANVESLKKHVEQAGEEAIACLNFHLTFAKLMHKRKKRKTLRRQNSESDETSGGSRRALLRFLVFHLLIFWIVLFFIILSTRNDITPIS
ncbi:PREDICTED: protein FAM170A-like isoform X2 [Chinchilla lanigera]|uniref:protein FAM170A-like isoform X2 n=1 Tax=Chinchilla lanigera TaxID=34839 RepID=UPI00038EFE2B|nr:PREDICTED: protein FAM170A-like isoform X2 [Chinchilla lanigera]